MKQNVVLQIVKGIVLAYFLSALALVVLSFVMYKWDVSESVIRGGILFAYVFSCFIGGMAVSRQHNERKYLWGLLMGAIYFVILWGVATGARSADLPESSRRWSCAFWAACWAACCRRAKDSSGNRRGFVLWYL